MATFHIRLERIDNENVSREKLINRIKKRMKFGETGKFKMKLDFKMSIIRIFVEPNFFAEPNVIVKMIISS